ncbi:type II toxin-antitoxin system PemK/MazF family toxin [Listeria monocytogenes]|uniref:type II toxin-antitoxin system PemK/MazF family toxin n=1 Tax=Listeria monocytogenes TaxID=1639 RepID=UPI001EDFDBCB|nr:type II toxin-antitoxin system PemK/MazF family toxin [Listeria monocytogenes]
MVKQGDIIKINLNPKQEHEQQGYRPYICLSHNLVSDHANIAIFLRSVIHCVTIRYKCLSRKQKLLEKYCLIN